MNLSPETVRAIFAEGAEYVIGAMARELQRAQFYERVAGYLAEHPDASANEVYREVGQGSAKARTLEAVRALRRTETGDRSNPTSRSAHGSGLTPDRIRTASPEESGRNIYHEAGS